MARAVLTWATAVGALGLVGALGAQGCGSDDAASTGAGNVAGSGGGDPTEGGAGASGAGGSNDAGGAGGAGGGSGGKPCIDPSQLPTAPKGTVSVAGTCAGAPSCAAPVEGSWRYSEACVEKTDLFEQVYGVCSTATIGQLTSQSLSGTLKLLGGTMTRDVQLSAEVMVTLPNNCTFCQCSNAEAQLQSAGFVASCSPQCTPDCTCFVRKSRSTTDTGSYTFSGGVLTTGSGETISACASPTKLTLASKDAAGNGSAFVLVPDEPFTPPEVCDGQDNDHNGKVDDSPVECPSCKTLGVCGAGSTATCAGSAGWACTYASPAYEAAETKCDGLDNDCNGVVDEPPYCGPEVCDGKDNDGDGKIDVGLTDTPPSCDTLGVCAGATAACKSGAWRCSYPATWEAVETKCDGLDNDCNGQVDEPQACCVPKQCTALDCGVIDDGCNGTKTCADCTGKAWCGGGGTPNRCGCTATASGTTGAVSAGEGAEDASPAGAGWSSWGAITVEDASDPFFSTGSAWARLTSTPGVSNFLLARQFGLDVPPIAQIHGIQVDVRRSARDGYVADQAVRLVKGGALQAADRSIGDWAVPYGYVTFGGPTDLWGTTWTAADVNASSFGAAFQAKYLTISGNDDARIDVVRITVFYDVACN